MVCPLLSVKQLAQLRELLKPIVSDRLPHSPAKAGPFSGTGAPIAVVQLRRPIDYRALSPEVVWLYLPVAL